MNRLPIAAQEGALRSYFPKARITKIGHDEFNWTHTLTPSPLSGTYKIRLNYKNGGIPKVYVIEPKPLKLANSISKLPHVYSQVNQRLCIYYPLNNEWNNSMSLVKTIIPWTCEWLLHYEIWVVTGVWNGGGIEHSNEEEKQND